MCSVVVGLSQSSRHNFTVLNGTLRWRSVPEMCSLHLQEGSWSAEAEVTNSIQLEIRSTRRPKLCILIIRFFWALLNHVCESFLAGLQQKSQLYKCKCLSDTEWWSYSTGQPNAARLNDDVTQSLLPLSLSLSDHFTNKYSQNHSTAIVFNLCGVILSDKVRVIESGLKQRRLSDNRNRKTYILEQFY